MIILSSAVNPLDLLGFALLQELGGTCVAAEMVRSPVYGFFNGFAPRDVHLALRVLNHLINHAAVLAAINPVFRPDDCLYDPVCHISEHNINDKTHERDLYSKNVTC